MFLAILEVLVEEETEVEEGQQRNEGIDLNRGKIELWKEVLMVDLEEDSSRGVFPTPKFHLRKKAVSERKKALKVLGHLRIDV